MKQLLTFLRSWVGWWLVITGFLLWAAVHYRYDVQVLDRPPGYLIRTDRWTGRVEISNVLRGFRWVSILEHGEPRRVRVVKPAVTPSKSNETEPR